MRWTALLVLGCAVGVPLLFFWEQTPYGPSVLLTEALARMVPTIFHVQRLITPTREDTSDKAEFDFIVVGAGTAGSVLANRLTERPEWKVLLLEAGGEAVPIMDVPFFVGQFHRTDANWQYVTTPQTTICGLMDDSRCDYPAGRVLGGSTMINFMVSTRGNPKDYDNWAAMGNEGWSFTDVLPYFKKVEDIQIPQLQKSTYRGQGGKIKISNSRYFSDMGHLILRALAEAGFRVTEDYDGEQQTGASRIQSTTYEGARWSANAGYLDEARKRPNLFLRQNSHVTQVVIEGGRAKAVRYVRGGQETVAYAMKEVILSAGAVNSPAILMRSGIGPKDHLQELGIPLVKDLPVGHNLMDHAIALRTFITFNQTVSPGIPEMFISPQSHLDYFMRRSGPLTAIGSFETLSFHDLEGTPYHSPGWPEVEIFFSSVNPTFNKNAAKSFRLQEEAFDEMLGSVGNKPVMMAAIFRCRPKSRGRIFLLNNSTFSTPQIDLNALSDPEDVEVTLAGFKEYLKLLATPSFQKLGAQLVDTPVPGCKDFVSGTDDFHRCAIRQLSTNIYHQSGTCKMGPRGDATAVVTPELKVVGVDGLHVVDASIMPLIISGHLQIPTYMIGEKAADLVKKQYAK